MDISVDIYQQEMVEMSGKQWVLVEDPQAPKEKLIEFERQWLCFAVSEERAEGTLIVPEEDMVS